MIEVLCLVRDSMRSAMTVVPVLALLGSALSAVALAQTANCSVVFEKEDAIKKDWLVSRDKPLVAECWHCSVETLFIGEARPERNAPAARKPVGVESKEMVESMMSSTAGREKAINSMRAALQREKPECSFKFQVDDPKVVGGIHFFAVTYFRQCPMAPEHLLSREWLTFDRGCTFKVSIAGRYPGTYQDKPFSQDTEDKIQALLNQVRWRSQ